MLKDSDSFQMRQCFFSNEPFDKRHVMSIQDSALNIHGALLNIHGALLNIYGPLWGVYGALFK